VVAIVLFSSVFLLLRSSPERIVVVSTDQLLRVEGVSRSAGHVVIQRFDDVATTIPASSGLVYEATLTAQGTLLEAQLTFALSELPVMPALHEVAIYVFDRETLAWESLPTFFDLDQQTVFANVEFSGSLLIGLGRRVL
jgi:hypothetical protein